ncbi:hypothetical protein Dform_01482 [Dehalogenimonas formicexedens]|uniref:AB hydrolase-1 domain-containing protein n=1 Tax=Dehalogenimonas formicexedens TaxID=1839801 RepID=A0A1P8F8K6_9CHLR|nr:alpha/beta fold hydrolase [Dehalogenimonas formicexedens]APV44804.1 hypothetical protein Dform_01482 [Dehalogenimonas formicexedens]
MTVPRLPLTADPALIAPDYQNVSFPSRDGIDLKGWFFPGWNGAVIVIVHGGFQNRVDDVANTMGIARDLAKSGFNLLLFDLSGRGESGGKGVSLKYEPSDIGGAVDYLAGRGFDNGSIGLMGFCSGAAGVCIYSAGNRVGAVVLDGCFPTVQTMVVNQARESHIPVPLLKAFYSTMRQIVKYSYRYEEQDPIDFVSRIDSPIFLIHEEFDDLVSYQDTLDLYSRANVNDISLWEVTGAYHSRAYDRDPLAYIDKVAGYFESRLAK